MALFALRAAEEVRATEFGIAEGELLSPSCQPPPWHRGTESSQTLCWSKPDSNCRSHLLEHMELQADAVTAKVGHVASFAFFDGLLARCL
jgi:hypothetical protein